MPNSLRLCPSGFLNGACSGLGAGDLCRVPSQRSRPTRQGYNLVREVGEHRDALSGGRISERQFDDKVSKSVLRGVAPDHSHQ